MKINKCYKWGLLPSFRPSFFLFLSLSFLFLSLSLICLFVSQCLSFFVSVSLSLCYSLSLTVCLLPRGGKWGGGSVKLIFSKYYSSMIHASAMHFPWLYRKITMAKGKNLLLLIPDWLLFIAPSLCNGCSQFLFQLFLCHRLASQHLHPCSGPVSPSILKHRTLVS